MSRYYQLKIKIKTLAEEARIIRKEERFAKVNRNTGKLVDLHEHRIHKVRPEARATLLAYGYLRGKAYRSIEGRLHVSRPFPEWHRVFDMVARYGPPELFEGVKYKDHKEHASELLKAWREVRP